MIGNGSGSPPGNRPKPKAIHHLHIKDEKETKRRLKSSFRRVEIPLLLDEDKRTLVGSAVLAEIKPRSCYIFLREKIAKHSTLTLQIKEPLAIDVRGRVRYCEPADRGQKAHKPTGRTIYRAQIEFMISSDAEGDALNDLYQQIRDENYVATKWHHYITERNQQKVAMQQHEEKLAEKVKDLMNVSDLASPDMLVEQASPEKNDDVPNTKSVKQKKKAA